MNCMNCGNAITPGAKFCPRCGTPAADQASHQAQQGYTSPPIGQMQTSWNVGQQQSSQFGPPPRKKSRLGKILLIASAFLVVIGIGAGVAVYFGYRYLESSLKNSEPYRLAVDELKRNPQAAEHLGTINDTGFPVGNFKENSGGTGSAAFTMSVDGEKADGHYVVTMNRTGGKWKLTNGYLRLPDGQIVDLSEGATGAVESEPSSSNINTNNEARFGGGKQAVVNGGALDAKAIEKPSPAYPAAARAVRASGKVTVQITVDEQGRVVEANAVNGHPLLRAAAVAAARSSRFKPTLLSGKPIRVTGTITYDFKPE